jgi:hypothetical protein
MIAMRVLRPKRSDKTPVNMEISAAASAEKASRVPGATALYPSNARYSGRTIPR